MFVLLEVVSQLLLQNYDEPPYRLGKCEEQAPCVIAYLPSRKENTMNLTMVVDVTTVY